MLVEEVKNEFKNHVIPFWKSLKDEEYGGYYGWLDYDLKLDKKSEKGCILNSRILWFFSNAYMYFCDEELKEYAKHAYEFFKELNNSLFLFFRFSSYFNISSTSKFML